VKSAAMPLRAIRSASELFWESARERDPVLLVLADSLSCLHCRRLLAGPLREAADDLGMKVWTVRPSDLGASVHMLFKSGGVPQMAYMLQGCVSRAKLYGGAHSTHDIVMGMQLLPLLDGNIPHLPALASAIGVHYTSSLGAASFLPASGAGADAAACAPAGATPGDEDFGTDQGSQNLAIYVEVPRPKPLRSKMERIFGPSVTDAHLRVEERDFDLTNLEEFLMNLVLRATDNVEQQPTGSYVRFFRNAFMIANSPTSVCAAANYVQDPVRNQAAVDAVLHYIHSATRTH